MEFLLVSLVVLAIAGGLSTMLDIATEGSLLAHATAEASHTARDAAMGSIGDVALF
jgi:hypothetical protein